MSRAFLLLFALLCAGAASAAPGDVAPDDAPAAPQAAPTPADAPPPAAPTAEPAPEAPADTDTPPADTDAPADDTDLDVEGTDTDTDLPEPDPDEAPYVWMGAPLPAMWLAGPEEADTDVHGEPHTDDTDVHGEPHTDDTDAHGEIDTTPAAGAAGSAGETEGVEPPEPVVPDGADTSDGEERAVWSRFMPELRLRGLRWALVLALLTMLAWGGARALDPVRELLAPNGILPALAIGLQQLLRLIVLFLGLGVIAAVVPADIAPALPFVVLAAAVAIGWSARDVMPDLLAGMVITAERRIRPDRWIATSEVAGIVEQVALRVTWLRDATGRRIAIPNRALLRDAVITDRGRWPTVELVVRVPDGHAPSEVRRVVEDAILVSPWAAPVGAEMVNEEPEPGRWRVRARVLEGRFADRFEGALREHVEEVLSKGTRLRE